MYVSTNKHGYITRPLSQETTQHNLEMSSHSRSKHDYEGRRRGHGDESETGYRRDRDRYESRRRESRRDDERRGERRERDSERDRTQDREREGGRDGRDYGRDKRKDYERPSRRSSRSPTRPTPPSRRRSRSRSKSPSSAPLEDKAKPNFNRSGLLAAATNTVKLSDGTNTVLKYNEPPEARKPMLGWRLYVFKGKDELGEKATFSCDWPRVDSCILGFQVHCI